VACEVVAESGAKVIDSAVAAVAPFEPRTSRPTRGKASDVLTGWPGSSGNRRLCKQRRGGGKNRDHAEKDCPAKPLDCRFQTGLS
jgi:hypothetical protein